MTPAFDKCTCQIEDCKTGHAPGACQGPATTRTAWKRIALCNECKRDGGLDLGVALVNQIDDYGRDFVGELDVLRHGQRAAVKAQGQKSIAGDQASAANGAGGNDASMTRDEIFVVGVLAGFIGGFSLAVFLIAGRLQALQASFDRLTAALCDDVIEQPPGAEVRK